MVVTFIEIGNTASDRGLNRQNSDEPSLECAGFEVPVMKRSLLIFPFEAVAFSFPFE